jgi:thioredoxin 2
MVTSRPSAVVSCGACGKRNRVPQSAGSAKCAACHTFLPLLIAAGDDTFDEAVTGSKVPVLVDIWAPWCGPCRAVSPILERLASDYAGRLKVVKVNADQAPQTSARHHVTSIPTLLMYSGGHETSRTVGAAPAEQLRRWVQQAIGEERSSPQ